VSILAAIRFIEAAAVGEAAAGLARRLGEPLHLVHVLPAESAQVPGDGARSFIHGALAGLARRLGTNGLRVTFHVAVGEAQVELLRAVADSHALLLVAGLPPPEAGRGRGGTVDRLSETCPVPMLAVSDAEPFASWGPERPLRVAVGVDTSRPAYAAVALVKMLAEKGPVELTAVRIVYPLLEARRFGLPLPVDFQNLGAELTTALQREVEDALQGARSVARSTRVVLHPSIGNPAGALVAMAEESEAEVLVLGTHHRRALGRLWSVSQHTLRLRRMAVLTVPGSAATSSEPRSFHTVLAATDFSLLGDEAVALGHSALHKGGTLHLLHVAKSQPSTEERVVLLRRLRGIVSDADEGLGIEAEVRIRNQPQGSDEAACILQSAERIGADLIALGASRHSTLSMSVLGSVAMKVMAGAHTPLLIARPPE
jgi:nucleotide-binding universal stress UspA family protein